MNNLSSTEAIFKKQFDESMAKVRYEQQKIAYFLDISRVIEHYQKIIEIMDDAKFYNVKMPENFEGLKWIDEAMKKWDK